MPQFYVTLPSKKMGIFEVGFLTISHLLTWIVSMIIRVVIYNYLTKKPPGTVFENHHKKSSFISLGLKIQMRHFDWFSNPVPGLQSVLDLLIIDLVKAQMFNYAFFMCCLFIGIFHGQLPFFASQLIVFILQNSDVYVLGLFQCFLVIKAVLIFRGSWMAEVTDSWILRLYR